MKKLALVLALCGMFAFTISTMSLAEVNSQGENDADVTGTIENAAFISGLSGISCDITYTGNVSDAIEAGVTGSYDTFAVEHNCDISVSIPSDSNPMELSNNGDIIEVNVSLSNTNSSLYYINQNYEVDTPHSFTVYISVAGGAYDLDAQPAGAYTGEITVTLADPI